jgi:hypothetical protein
MDSALNSDAFAKIVSNPDDRRLIENRIKLFVNNVRKKNPYSNDEFSKAVKNLNRFTNIAVGQALGGITQPIKQTVPIALNTLVNAGDLDVASIFDKSKQDFISNSGYGIANRGGESQAQIESVSKLIDEAAKSKGAKSLKFIEKANKAWLKNTLIRFDLVIARASWMTYYEQSLKQQGIDPANIDYSTHELNKKAADYAQRQVDRQQNISDTDLAGALLSSKDAKTQLAVKVIMPFASFRMSQSARIGSDIATLTNKTSTIEDKKIAARSLAGAGVETAAFRALSTGVLLMIGAAVKFAMGREDDEEKDKKRKDAIIKGQLTSTVADLFSPTPIFDKAVQLGVSNILELTQDALDIEEKNRLSIYTGNKQDLFQSLGLLGITGTRLAQLVEMINLSSGGSYKDDYGRKKYLSPSDREALTNLVPIAVLSSIGLAPTEANSVVRGAISDAKRNASTNETGIKQEKEATPNMSKEDMKKYFPEMYNEMYGPGGSLYEVEQMKKEIRKEKERLNKEIKDEMYR